MASVPVPANGNPTPTADQLASNPNPREHVVTDDDVLTSDEKVLEQQMTAAFEQHQQRLQQMQQGQSPAAPAQPQSVVPQQPSATPPTQSPTLTQEIEAAFTSTPPPTQTPQQQTATPEPPQQETQEVAPTDDNDRVKYMQRLFKDTMGVDVSQAVDTMNNFNQTAEGTIGQMQEMSNKIALQQQRLDLMYTWGAEAQQLGMTATELVEQRLAETTQVFSTLNEGLRTKIASEGSKGIIDLYNLIQKNKGSQQPVVTQQPQMTVPVAGRANIAETPQNGASNTNLSEIVAIESEDEFWNRLQKGYTDNLGVIRR